MTPNPPGSVAADPTRIHPVGELKHSSPLFGCRIDPSGQYVCAGAQDNAVVRWHLATGKKTVLTGHRSWVRGLAFAPKAGLVFSADYAGRVIAWPLDAETPAPRVTLDAHRGWVRALAVSPDGKLLATCGNDHLVRLWSIPSAAGTVRPVREFAGHDCHVYNVAFHPGGAALVSADLKGIVKEWDLATGAVRRTLDAKVLHKYDPTFRADIGGARAMTFRPDGGVLACAGITDVSNAFAGVGRPVVVQFDWATGKPTLLRPKQPFQGTAWGVAYHPAGFVVAAGGGSGGALWFWKPGQTQDFFTFKLPTNARDLDLHPDHRRLAVACNDGSVRLYDMGSKKS